MFLPSIHSSSHIDSGRIKSEFKQRSLSKKNQLYSYHRQLLGNRSRNIEKKRAQSILQNSRLMEVHVRESVRVISSLAKQVKRLNSQQDSLKNQIRYMGYGINQFSLLSHMNNSNRPLQQSAFIPTVNNTPARPRYKPSYGTYDPNQSFHDSHLSSHRQSKATGSNSLKKRSIKGLLRRASQAIRLGIAFYQFYHQKIQYRKYSTNKIFEQKGTVVMQNLLVRFSKHAATVLKFYSQLVVSRRDPDKIKLFLQQFMHSLQNFSLQRNQLQLLALISCQHSVVVSDVLTQFQYKRLQFNAKQPYLRNVSTKQTQMIAHIFIVLRILVRYLFLRPWNLDKSLQLKQDSIADQVQFNASLIYGSVISHYIDMPNFNRPSSYAQEHSLKLKSYIQYKKQLALPAKGCLLSGINLSHPKSFSQEHKAWYVQFSKSMERWASRVAVQVQSQHEQQRRETDLKIKCGDIRIFEQKTFKLRR